MLRAAKHLLQPNRHSITHILLSGRVMLRAAKHLLQRPFFRCNDIDMKLYPDDKQEETYLCEQW